MEPGFACRESCPEALTPICGKKSGGAFEIFGNPYVFHKANFEGLGYVQTDFLECRGLVCIMNHALISYMELLLIIYARSPMVKGLQLKQTLYSMISWFWR